MIHDADWDSGSIPYDVSGYKPGLYVVQVRSDDVNEVRRVVILDAY